MEYELEDGRPVKPELDRKEWWPIYGACKAIKNTYHGRPTYADEQNSVGTGLIICQIAGFGAAYCGLSELTEKLF